MERGDPDYAGAPYTRQIAGILKEYPDGTQIARELLQNSDDAGSKEQWYLLDYHNFSSEPGSKNFRLYRQGLQEFLGPALLAGNDSMFRKEDFKSMKELANSTKRIETGKIGQMGIGFNSIYHMTDTPSFISGDQFMMIDPHQWVFTRGNCYQDTFTKNQEDLNFYPDQLRTFDVLEKKIDFSQPYNGTIFRFPLRTQNRARQGPEGSCISSNEYTTEMVQEMFSDLKNEALKCMLFLRNIQKISIFERRSIAEGPKLLFKIEIDPSVVLKPRQDFLDQFAGHLQSHDSELGYTITPKFKLTQQDGTVTFEEWRVSTLVGNFHRSLEYLSVETGRDIDNLSDQKLIPWVGIASPSEYNVNIRDTGRTGLFCFLPISINIPFPIHINGQFAVKPSRREIWTDQDGNIGKKSSQYVNCMWNIHLFKTHIPKIYAKFLEQMGTTHDPNYDLWPVLCESDIGVQRLWKDLLPDVLRIVLKDNLKVFFCERGGSVIDYRSAYFTGCDLNSNPTLLQALQSITSLVMGLPDAILDLIPGIADSLDLENRILTPESMRSILKENKDSWSRSATSEAKIEILKFCIEDDNIADLEGLPLLPLANGEWVEFESGKSSVRYLVPDHYLSLLQRSNEGLIDVTMGGGIIELFRDNRRFDRYWSRPTADMMAAKIKDISSRYLDFQSDGWITNFWNIVCEGTLPLNFLGKLEGLCLLPLNNRSYGPLSRNNRVPYIYSSREETREFKLRPFFDIVCEQLGCNVLLNDARDWESFAEDYTFEISNVTKTITMLSSVPAENLISLDQQHRAIVFKYISNQLRLQLNSQLVSTLRTLPIYPIYHDSNTPQYVSVQYPNHDAHLWRVARGYSPKDYPWLPKSVKLLDGELLGNGQLSKDCSISGYSESQYWCDILSNLKGYPENQWDMIFFAFSKRYHDIRTQESSLQKSDVFRSILIDLPFIPVTTPDSQGSVSSVLRRPPREIVDPSLSQFYLRDECVFPKGDYTQSHALRALKTIGIRTTVDSDFYLERVRVLAKHANDGKVEEVSVPMSHIYSSIDTGFAHGTLTVSSLASLRDERWIIAANTAGGLQCCTPIECRPKEDTDLVETQMPIATFKFHSDKFMALANWDQPPPLDKVLARFQSLINPESSSATGTTALKPDLSIKFYECFKLLMNNSDSLKKMKDALHFKPWILIGSKLYSSEKVTLSSSLNLRPHYIQCNLPGFDQLFIAMGCRETVEQSDLKAMISEIGDKYGEDQLPPDEIELVVEMLKGISHDSSYQMNPDLLVPADDKRLYSLDQVVFDDTNARNDKDLRDIVCDENSIYVFLNDHISRELAVKLGVAMFSARYWEELRDSEFEDWSQNISVMDRIKTFLNDYDPSDIFVEFLQNAADAGATRFKFILDKRSFETNKLLSPNMAAWQGPAFIICNDAKFTKDDFKGICTVDRGSKKGDSTKIGRHGLGFNSVYHFTDVPSVVSGSDIGFFDPQRVYLPTLQTSKGMVTQGGLKCNFTQRSGGAYTDQWSPYVGYMDCDMSTGIEGTIFRIPLRTDDVKILGTYKGKRWDIERIEDMVRNFVDVAQVGMLFLEKMDTIEIGIISDSPDDKSVFSKEIKKSFDDVNLKKKYYTIDHDVSPNDSVPKERIRPVPRRNIKKDENVTSVKKSEDNRAGSIPEFVIEARKKDEGYRARVIQIRSPPERFQWMVLTNDRFPEEPPNDIVELGKENRWHPHAGIAIPLDNFNIEKSKTKFKGKIFAHLPTPITTELPFHIHGGFALTSNRKSIAGADELEKLTWNNYLMEKCLPEVVKRAYINLLVLKLWEVKRVEVRGAIEDYYKYWPTTSGDNNNTRLFVQSLLRLLHCSPVFPIEGPQGQQMRFLNGSEVDFFALQAPQVPEEIEEIIYSYLVKESRNVSRCPTPIQTLLFSHWKSKEPSPKRPHLSHTVVDPRYILDVVSRDNNFITERFSSTDQKKWIVGYTLTELLKRQDYTEDYLSSLNLIPLMDGSWKSLSGSKTCFVAIKEMTRLLSNKSYFLDMSVFDTENSSYSNQGILNGLKDCNFGVTQLTETEFTKLFNSENPNGPSDDKRRMLYSLLSSYTNLVSFHELLILKATDGKIYPLRRYLDIDISQVSGSVSREFIESLSGILGHLGHIIYNGTENLDHPYIRRNVHCVNQEFILRHISSPLAIAQLSDRMTNDIARVIRCLISKLSVNHSVHLAAFGDLKIWPSYLSDVSRREGHLIKARGSKFIRGDYSLNNLGDYPDVIYGYSDSRILKPLGASSMGIKSALNNRVTPRFLDGSLAWAGDSKTAYIDIFISYCYNVYNEHQLHFGVLKDQLVPTRSGEFKINRNLYCPHDHLIETMFGEDRSLLPDEELWSRVNTTLRSVFSFKSSSQLSTVVECASHLTSLINEAGETANPIILEKSKALVRFIYSEYGSVSQHSWMNMRIVPADRPRKTPFHDRLPQFRRYLSFEELMDPQYYEVCWTQNAFFREDLKPSESVIKLNPHIGKPSVSTVVNHLVTLVTEIAELTTSKEKLRRFRESLFGTYEWLNDYVKNGSDSAKKILCDELGKIKRPYILNGKDKFPKLESSWWWPKDLVLDIDDVIYQYAANESILEYREFLLITGARTLEKTKHQVPKPELRPSGEIESALISSFRTQDKENGHMDIVFRFSNECIMAHKYVLKFTSRHFETLFNGIWGTRATTSPLFPGMDVIDIDDENTTLEVFAGFLYFLYTSRLINEQEPIPGVFGQPSIQRLEYLLQLLERAHYYDDSTLMDLIAIEILENSMSSSVDFMDIYHSAENYGSEAFRKSVVKHFVTNKTYFVETHGQNIEECRKKLGSLSEGDIVERENLEAEINALEIELVDFNNLVK